MRQPAGDDRAVPILIGHAGVYDTLTRLLLGSLYGRIAADVAAVAPTGARVLEVGCGPGQLSIRLARHHRLQVTGLDLDPARGAVDNRRRVFSVSYPPDSGAPESAGAAAACR